MPVAVWTVFIWTSMHMLSACYGLPRTPGKGHQIASGKGHQIALYIDMTDNTTGWTCANHESSAIQLLHITQPWYGTSVNGILGQVWRRNLQY